MAGAIETSWRQRVITIISAKATVATDDRPSPARLPSPDHEAAGHAAFGLGCTRLLAGRYRDAERWLAEAELCRARRPRAPAATHGSCAPIWRTPAQRWRATAR